MRLWISFQRPWRRWSPARTIESRALLPMGPRSVRSLETLGRRSFELLVIGGGIVGARVALEASRAWPRVALVDAGGSGEPLERLGSWYTVDCGTCGRGDFGRPRGARCGLVQEAVTDDGRLTSPPSRRPRAGTVAANHVRVTALSKHRGKVSGALLKGREAPSPGSACCGRATNRPSMLRASTFSASVRPAWSPSPEAS